MPPHLLAHPEIAQLRQQILDATDELHALMLGPVGLLTTPAVGVLFVSLFLCLFVGLLFCLKW